MTQQTPPTITVIIPAYMEEARITDTVAAASAIEGVTRVLVVDDGSTDRTAARARCAGAEVVSLAQNMGKGAALRAGLAACPGDAQDIYLLLDADLGATAGDAEKLLAPLLRDEADLVIATFPKRPGKNGFGLVKGLAYAGTRLLTGQCLEAPISGQRACRRWVLETAPIADGYGVEVAMNIAAGDAGARIVEVPVQMTHHVTGRNWQGFVHRGRQFRHIFAACVSAALGRTGEPLLRGLAPLRIAWWFLAVLLLLIGLAPGNWWGILGRGCLATVLGIGIAALASGILRARKRNYLQRYIPALGGLLLLPAGCWTALLVYEYWGGFPSAAHRFPAILYILLPVFLGCWLLLGLYDDVKGDASRKGFHGHLSALRQGKLTAGAVKLLVGGLLALAAAGGLAWSLRAPWHMIPVSALLIALSANAMNLFDLRPGRALKVFWVIMAPLAVAAGQGDVLLMQIGVVFLLVTLLYAPLDFSGMMMLGDTGSNPLGALIGVFLILALPAIGQVCAVLLLVALHLYAERVSITKTIERVGWLRWLDQLGR